MTGRRARAVRSCNEFRRNTVARTTQRRQEAATSQQGRFGRGSTGQPQARRRFARSAGQSAPRRRHRQPEQSGAQKLMQGIRGVLPGGGKSSTDRRSGGSIPVVGGLLSSLGGTKKRGAGGTQKRGAGRGRKPAVFGLLGAGAAGAAAAVAKRRHGSRSPQPPEGNATGMPEPQTPSTAAPAPAHPADAPMPGETAQPSDDLVGDETTRKQDTPAEGDQRG